MTNLLQVKPVTVYNERGMVAIACPLPALGRTLTPNDLHYVLNHYGVPHLELESWRLRVEGEVERPFSVTYEDLLRLPPKTLTTTLECAGNGRGLFNPPAFFVPIQWRHEGVSTARWRGIPLGTLLKRAGIKPTAQVVVLEGADTGGKWFSEETLGSRIPFARSLPLEKALHYDTILAYKMNGKPLPREHGFPVRVVVPGWFGMASVKWLVRVDVLDHPFDGFHQVESYIYEWSDERENRQPVDRMKVKSVITAPLEGEAVMKGTYRIRGLAWAGEADVTSVEVSVDGGQQWRVAHLLGRPTRYSWRSWHYRWKPSETGEAILIARATDSLGNMQPIRAKWNRHGCGNNSIHAVRVKVH